MKIAITNEAKNDILNLHQYIAYENISIANKLVNEILNCIDSLKENYNSGFKLSNHTKRKTKYRFKIVKPYLIFYKIYDTEILVSRVIHASMNYLKILNI